MRHVDNEASNAQVNNNNESDSRIKLEQSSEANGMIANRWSSNVMSDRAKKTSTKGVKRAWVKSNTILCEALIYESRNPNAGEIKWNIKTKNEMQDDMTLNQRTIVTSSHNHLWESPWMFGRRYHSFDGLLHERNFVVWFLLSHIRIMRENAHLIHGRASLHIFGAHRRQHRCLGTAKKHSTLFPVNGRIERSRGACWVWRRGDECGLIALAEAFDTGSSHEETIVNTLQLSLRRRRVLRADFTLRVWQDVIEWWAQFIWGRVKVFMRAKWCCDKNASVEHFWESSSRSRWGS